MRYDDTLVEGDREMGQLLPWQMSLAEWYAVQPTRMVPRAAALAKATELAGCDISHNVYRRLLAQKTFKDHVQLVRTNTVRAARRKLKSLLPKAVNLYDKAMTEAESGDVKRARAAAPLVALAFNALMPKKQEHAAAANVVTVMLNVQQQKIADEPIPEVAWEPIVEKALPA